MKIYPRRIKVQEGVNKYELKIQNSSIHDQVLLFRIRRSPVKVLSFRPKKGYVPPGETLTIVIALLSHQFLKTRLLIKLVVLPRVLFVSDFVKSWNMGCEYKGEVKKIIDIICPSLPSINEETEGFGTPSSKFEDSSDQYSDMISETSSYSYMMSRSMDFPSMPIEQSNEFQAINFDTPANVSPYHHRRAQSHSGKHQASGGNEALLSYYTHRVDENQDVNVQFMQSNDGMKSNKTIDKKNDNNMSNKDTAILQILQHITQQLITPMDSTEANAINRNELIRTAHMLTEMLHKNTTTAATTTPTPAITAAGTSSGEGKSARVNILASLDTIETRTTTASAPSIPSPAATGATPTTWLPPPPINTTLPATLHQSLYPPVYAVNQSQPQLQRQITPSSTPQATPSSRSSSHQQVLPPQPQSVFPPQAAVSQSYPPSYQQQQQSSMSSSRSVYGQYNNKVDTMMEEQGPYEVQHDEDDDYENNQYDDHQGEEVAHDEQEQQEDEEINSQQLGSISTIDRASVASSIRPFPSSQQQQQQQSYNSITQNLDRYQNYHKLSFDQAALEIFGEEVTDIMLKSILEIRIISAIATREQVKAIEITGTQITHIYQSVGGVFTTSNNANNNQDVTQEELTKLRSVYYEEHLKSLSMIHGQIYSVDPSLNRFQCLTTLNLSYNTIKSLDTHLALPNLITLNLAYNQLKSLDCLQSFHSLQTLIVHHNRLSSLKHSIHVLVPLARSLTTLDLSDNEVCLDPRYAEETVLTLPRLKVFDGIEIDALYRTYLPLSAGNKAYSNTITTLLSTTNNNNGTGGGRKSPPQSQNLPVFPCNAEEYQPTSFATTTTTANNISQQTSQHVNKQKEKQRDAFINQLKRSLGLRIYQTRREKYESEYGLGIQEQEEYALEEVSPEVKNTPWEEQYSHVHHSTNNVPAAASFVQDNRSFYEQSPRSAAKGGKKFNQPRQGSVSNNSMNQSMLNVTLPNRASYATTLSSSSSMIAAQQSQLGGGGGTTVIKTITSSSTGGLTPSRRNRYAEDTNSSLQRKQSQVPLLIPHWKGRTDTKPHMLETIPQWTPTVIPVDTSILPTQVMPSSPRHHLVSTERGYHSDGETGHLRTSWTHSMRSSYNSQNNNTNNHHNVKDVLNLSVEADQYNRIMEGERMHPRYKTPKPIFGHSKPFVYRQHIHANSNVKHSINNNNTNNNISANQSRTIPYYDETVKRLRDGFEKLPPRGTFNKASKGLTSDWYPMDLEEHNTIRKQGYSHEVIGEVKKFAPAKYTTTIMHPQQQQQHATTSRQSYHNDRKQQHDHNDDENENEHDDNNENAQFDHIYSAQGGPIPNPLDYYNEQIAKKQHQKTNNGAANPPPSSPPASASSQRQQYTPDTLQDFDQFVQSQHTLITTNLSNNKIARGNGNDSSSFPKYSQSPNVSPSRFSTNAITNNTSFLSTFNDKHIVSMSHHPSHDVSNNQNTTTTTNSLDYSVFYGLENLAKEPLASFHQQQQQQQKGITTNNSSKKSNYQPMKDNTLIQLENDLTNISQILNLSVSTSGTNNNNGKQPRHTMSSNKPSATAAAAAATSSPSKPTTTTTEKEKFDLLHTMKQKDSTVMASYLAWLEEQQKSQVLSNAEDHLVYDREDVMLQYSTNHHHLQQQQSQQSLSQSQQPRVVHPRDLAMKAERVSPNDHDDVFELNNPLKNLFRPKRGSVDDMAI